MFNFVITTVAAAMILYLVIKDVHTFVNILIVMLGFGAVIMIHEFGHFIVAKFSGIKVEAFSIGFPPTLVGIRKTSQGMRVRFLPGGGCDEQSEEGKEDEQVNESLTSRAMHKMGGTAKEEPDGTEYRIGLIPFGGFVKMLGQEDSGAVEATDDPASFSNKPISVRIGVVAAGVIFNAISAVLIFMAIFLVGVDLSPAVVGQVRPGSPAQIAGLRAKDRIISVQGEEFVDFMSLPIVAALSGKTEAIEFLVKRPDGTVEEMEIVAQDSKGVPMRTIGITQAETLTVARPVKQKNIKQLYELSGLVGGDIIKAFGGQNVSDAWHLKELVSQSLSPEVNVTVERTDEKTETKELVNVKLPLYASHTVDDFKTGYKLANIYSIVPRLKIVSLRDDTAPKKGIRRAIYFVREKILRKDPPAENPFMIGDIITKVGDTINPTFDELREITIEFADKAMAVEVLRRNGSSKLSAVSLTAYPRSGRKGVVTVGIVPSLDMENPIVAKTIAIENGPAALEIPSGAMITGVDGYDVANFYDVIRIIRKSRGEHINMEYRIDDENAGAVALNVPSVYDHIATENEFAIYVPDGYTPTGAFLFDYMTETFKADGPGEAIKMGLKKTYMFIAQTYVTLRKLVTPGDRLSPKTLVGPVGIVTLSYKIVASQSMTYYAYFLGLISSVIAVMNLLPIPIVDGGVIVLLIIEKIKGSPVSAKLQEIISYVGLVLIISLFLWLTYNDLLNLFFPM